MKEKYERLSWEKYLYEYLLLLIFVFALGVLRPQTLSFFFCVFFKQITMLQELVVVKFKSINFKSLVY